MNDDENIGVDRKFLNCLVKGTRQLNDITISKTFKEKKNEILSSQELNLLRENT